MKATYGGGLPSGELGMAAEATVEPTAIRVLLPDVGFELLPLTEVAGVRVTQHGDQESLIFVDYQRRGFRSTLRLATESHSDAAEFEQQVQRAKLALPAPSPIATVKRMATLNSLSDQALRNLALGVVAVVVLLLVLVIVGHVRGAS